MHMQRMPIVEPCKDIVNLFFIDSVVFSIAILNQVSKVKVAKYVFFLKKLEKSFSGCLCFTNYF